MADAPCAGCGKPLGDGDYDVGPAEREYHPACFVCKKCKKPFPGGEFFDGGDKNPYHEACLPKTAPGPGPASAAAAAAASAPADKCDGCAKEFGKGETYVSLKPKEGSTSKGLNFHDKCFVCDDCKQPIGTKPYAVSHGKPVHESCTHGAIARKTGAANEFEQDLKCAACGDVVRGRKKDFNGGVYHLTCLRCSKCSLGITGDCFLVDGKPVCHRCNK